jgi:hypothetical protein
LGRFIANETSRGIELAIADLEEHGEVDELDAMSSGGLPTPRGRCWATGSPRSR